MTSKTRKASKNQIYYSVRFSESVLGYTDLEIQVWTREMCNTYSDEDATVFAPIEVIRTPYHQDCDTTFTWQSRDSDRGTEGFSFYSAQNNFHANSLESLHLITKLARRLEKKIAEVKVTWSTEPADIFNALDQLKAQEIFYDRRVNGHVTRDQIMPEYMRSWRDDWKTMNENGCTVACYAENETEARRLIGAKLAKYRDDGAKLTKWVNYGQPVLDVGYDAPDATPGRQRVEELLAKYSAQPEIDEEPATE